MFKRNLILIRINQLLHMRETANPSHSRIKKPQVDEYVIAFLGGKLDDQDYEKEVRVIPYGDLIVSSFTVDKFEYIKTNSGLFIKGVNSTIISSCSVDRYNLAKSFLTLDDINHVELHENRFYKKFQKQNFDVPQAGLTRGSKRSFSDRAETQKNLIQKIQDKYKDGVL